MVLFVSLQIQVKAASSSDLVCHAEMKRTVIYTVDLLLDKDCVVVESQCQCGSGMGPEAHCKHVDHG